MGISNRDGNRIVSDVTYGTASLTQLGAQNGPGNANRADLWYLLDPPTGTATITVNFTSGAKSVGGAISFRGSDGAAPAGRNSAAGNSSSASVLSLLGSPGDVVVDTLAANGDALSASANGNQVERWNQATGTSGGEIIGAGSTQPGQLLLPSASWSLGTAKPWALVLGTISPAC